MDQVWHGMDQVRHGRGVAYGVFPLGGCGHHMHAKTAWTGDRAQHGGHQTGIRWAPNARTRTPLARTLGTLHGCPSGLPACSSLVALRQGRASVRHGPLKHARLYALKFVSLGSSCIPNDMGGINFLTIII